MNFSVRTPSIFNTVYSFFNSIMKDKMKQRVSTLRVRMLSSSFKFHLFTQLKVHGNDFESLHKEVSKDILPKEYGGEGMSLDELTGNFTNKYQINNFKKKN